MVRANYNYEVFPGVIEKVQDAEATRSQRVERFRNIAHYMFQSYRKELKTDTSQEVNNLIAQLYTRATSTLVEVTSDSIAQGSTTHEERVERIDSIKRYLLAMYSDRGLPPEMSKKKFKAVLRNREAIKKLRQDLLAVEAMDALLAQKQSLARKKTSQIGSSSALPISGLIAKPSVDIPLGKWKKSLDHLRLLIKRENAPADAYIKMAKVFLKQKKYSKADEVLHLGCTRIGRDFIFLPVQIMVKKAAGQRQAAEELAIRCQKYDNWSLDFGRLLGQGQAKITHYQRCSLALGYDVLAKRKKERKAASFNPFEQVLQSLLKK